MKILVVDDDAAQARALARAFARRRPDLQVLTSTNGFEAIETVKTQTVDAVLTDLRMPEMDGFELLSWLWHNQPALPVFAMSAYGDAEATHRLNEMGSIECFAKPLDVKTVLSKLSDAVAQTVQGHVRNVSLASLLQLMEMERKSCSLSVQCGDKVGELFLSLGKLVNARCGDLEGEAAAVEIVGWSNPSIAISSERGVRPRVIETSLGFIVMEAMRIQDEAARSYNDRASEHPAAMRLSTRAPLSDGEGVRLPASAYALAFVDTASGALLMSAKREGFPLEETAQTAALVIRQELSTLALCGASQSMQELVISTPSRGELIRALDPQCNAFALLVYSPEETNLVMARIELERFLLLRV